MIKFRELVDLTDEEISFIMKDIFKASRVDKIVRSRLLDKIACNIYICEEKLNQAHEIILAIPKKDKGISANDFAITPEEEWKWAQFLIAKGCDYRLKNNPYLEN